MMDAVSSLLCTVLRDFNAGGKTAFPSDADWQGLISLAVSHSVGGILAYQTLQSPENVQESVRSYLRGVCYQTVTIYTQRAQRMEKLSRKLTEQGIEHLPFKGYVLRSCYPVPELRTYGDVDFLIHPEDREKTHSLMLTLGFSVKTDWEPVYSYIRDDEYYEIHTEMLEAEPIPGGNAAVLFRRVWDTAAKEEGLRYTPEWGLHFAFLLAHLAKHVKGSGAGVRMYLDLAMLLKCYGTELDREELECMLHELGLRDFANAALGLTRELFGTESPFPLRELAPQVMDTYRTGTLAGGVFGQAAADPGVNRLKQGDGAQTKAGALLRRFFPPAEELEKRYTYLQKNAWLLPAAWVHRAVLTSGDTKKHLKEAKSILNADEQKAAQLCELYREIGL